MKDSPSSQDVTERVMCKSPGAARAQDASTVVQGERERDGVKQRVDSTRDRVEAF